MSVVVPPRCDASNIVVSLGPGSTTTITRSRTFRARRWELVVLVVAEALARPSFPGSVTLGVGSAVLAVAVLGTALAFVLGFTIVASTSVFRLDVGFLDSFSWQSCASAVMNVHADVHQLPLLPAEFVKLCLGGFFSLQRAVTRRRLHSEVSNVGDKLGDPRPRRKLVFEFLGWCEVRPAAAARSS